MHPLPFSDQRFDRAELERQQLELLNNLIARARAGSAFHRRRLSAEPLSSLRDLAQLPFMTPDDLREQANALIVPPQHVARMVSLPTSGTSGEPKRVAFTEQDLLDTRAFFASGLHCIARTGERTAVLFPSNTPDGMGALICAALGDIGAVPVTIDLGQGLRRLVEALAGCGATSAVGSGHMLLAIARFCARHNEETGIERVLVSSDNASRSLIAGIGEGLACEVFEHYGMTETGFGCAVDCHAHAGMHLREFDMIVEIVDPASGTVLPDGEEGEVVVTTLRREAMPVIRYRTGDLARIMPKACPCGGSLRRLGPVRGHALAHSAEDRELETAFDEALFALPGVIDYEACCSGDEVEVRLEVLGEVPSCSLPRTTLTVVPFDEDAPLRNPKLSRLTY